MQYLSTNIFFYTKFMLLSVMLWVGSCSQPFMEEKADFGSLRMMIGTDEPENMEEMLVLYEFSGTGPENESFSLSASDSVTTVNGLKTGDWTVRVEGLNEEGVVILEGESLITIEAYGETSVDIALSPSSGLGDISVSAEWNYQHTIDPSVVVTLIVNEEEVRTFSLSLVSEGSAEGIAEDLPTGKYEVTVQLFDSDTLVMGSAGELQVYKNWVTGVMAQFDNLNKVGLPIEITRESFTIGWDMDSQSDPQGIYHIYYRERDKSLWLLLDSIEAQPEPQFTVTKEMLPYGDYEFAVSIEEYGVESNLHTSMDDDAQPVSGWYVSWLGP